MSSSSEPKAGEQLNPVAKKILESPLTYQLQTVRALLNQERLSRREQVEALECTIGTLLEFIGTLQCDLPEAVREIIAIHMEQKLRRASLPKTNEG